MADCNYHQQNALVPFILHLFFGWFTGVGPFMLDRMDWGLASLLLCWGSVILFCVCACILTMTSSRGSTDSSESLTDSCTSCACCIIALAIIGLYAAVLVEIGSGHMKDGNGASIVPLR
jgi:TM2 domain-containing membrane protein YozV